MDDRRSWLSRTNCDSAVVLPPICDVQTVAGALPNRFPTLTAVTAALQRGGELSPDDPPATTARPHPAFVALGVQLLGHVGLDARQFAIKAPIRRRARSSS